MKRGFLVNLDGIELYFNDSFYDPYHKRMFFLTQCGWIDQQHTLRITYLIAA